MKKIILTVIIINMAVIIGQSQNNDGTFLQPTHVIGRRINSSGEITKEYSSDFTYLENGKLFQYIFPEYGITATFGYSGDFISTEHVVHQAGHPVFHEYAYYTYEKGQIKTIAHIMDNMGINQFWEYSYYDDGRLERKDYKQDYNKNDDDDDFYTHWLYDYENDGKTVIESYCTSLPFQGWRLLKKTTSQFDEDYTLVSVDVESYDGSGTLLSTTRSSYTYTPKGLLEAEVTQTLSGSNWVNTSITQNTYDDNDRIVEQLSGRWDEENDEWYYDHIITFSFSDYGGKYTVSFFKKNNGEWVWDVFNNQTVLFGSKLQTQQRFLCFMVFESMNGHGNVNQIEFTMEETLEPTYLRITEPSEMAVTVHPNPTSGFIAITGKDLHQAVVVNMLGQPVASATGEGGTLSVNIANQPAGVYFVNISDREGHKCVRKVVHKP